MNTRFNFAVCLSVSLLSLVVGCEMKHELSDVSSTGTGTCSAYPNYETVEEDLNWERLASRISRLNPFSTAADEIFLLPVGEMRENQVSLNFDERDFAEFTTIGETYKDVVTCLIKQADDPTLTCNNQVFADFVASYSGSETRPDDTLEQVKLYFQIMDREAITLEARYDILLLTVDEEETLLTYQRQVDPGCNPNRDVVIESLAPIGKNVTAIKRDQQNGNDQVQVQRVFTVGDFRRAYDSGSGDVDTLDLGAVFSYRSNQLSATLTLRSNECFSFNSLEYVDCPR